MSIRTWIAASAAAVVAPTALAVDAFSDFVLWEAAAGAPAITDDLSSYGVVDLVLGDNDFFDGYTVTLAGTDTGNTNINSASNLSFTLGGDLESITFTFDEPISGFGASWLNSFVTNGLTVTINGEALNVEDVIAEPDFDFIGFADSGGPLDGAVVTVTNPTGSTEFAAISEIHYAVIPAPATAGLLGLAGLAAARRRR
ncbi:MAG: hypothetical protein AAGK04_05865 [Planctomycetota bacterium]